MAADLIKYPQEAHSELHIPPWYWFRFDSPQARCQLANIVGICLLIVCGLDILVEDANHYLFG